MEIPAKTGKNKESIINLAILTQNVKTAVYLNKYLLLLELEIECKIAKFSLRELYMVHKMAILCNSCIVIRCKKKTASIETACW